MTEPSDGELAGLDQRAKIRFDLIVGNLYESVIRETRDLAEQHSKQGIASTGKYLRKVADAVETRFQTIEDTFKEVYVDPFKSAPISQNVEPWLRRAAQEIVEVQVTRAQGVMGQLSSSFVGATPNRFSAHLAQLQNIGDKIRKRLNDAITLLVLEHEVSSKTLPSLAAASSGVSVTPADGKGNKKWDVFVSHATEDNPYVEPLVRALQAAGISVWFDKTNLEWGDELRSEIDTGLINCRYGIVVFSKPFLSRRKWTEHELNSLFAREENGRKVILPIWHGISRNDLIEYSPALADRFAKILGKDSHSEIVTSLLAKLGRLQPSVQAGAETSVVAGPDPAKPNAVPHPRRNQRHMGRANRVVRRALAAAAGMVLLGLMLWFSVAGKFRINIARLFKPETDGRAAQIANGPSNGGGTRSDGSRSPSPTSGVPRQGTLGQNGPRPTAHPIVELYPPWERVFRDLKSSPSHRLEDVVEMTPLRDPEFAEKPYDPAGLNSSVWQGKPIATNDSYCRQLVQVTVQNVAGNRSCHIEAALYERVSTEWTFQNAVRGKEGCGN